MVYILGHTVETVNASAECWRGGDHRKLRNEARADRQRLQFNVDESCALCLRCGKAVPLKI